MLTKVVGLLVIATLCAAGKPRIVRPCSLWNYKCIADNLAANSNCSKAVEGRIPSEKVLPKFHFRAPYFNSSYIDFNLIVRNHHKCFVSEFFFNTAKDTAVLGIDCPDLDFESDRTLIQHYSLQEDVSYSYHIRGKYPLIRLTINIPIAGKIDICNAFVFPDVTALPTFHVNPNDRPTSNFLTRDLTELNIFEIESFAYKARPLATVFIDSILCDFGCPRLYSIPLKYEQEPKTRKKF